MSEYAFGAIFVLLVETFLTFVIAYVLIARDYWRDSKLPRKAHQ